MNKTFTNHVSYWVSSDSATHELDVANYNRKSVQASKSVKFVKSSVVDSFGGSWKIEDEERSFEVRVGRPNVTLDKPNSNIPKNFKVYDITSHSLTLSSLISLEGLSTLSPDIGARADQLLACLSEFLSFERTHRIVNKISDTEISFQWFRQEKQLSVYVLEDSIEYIKSWGVNIDTEMDDGEIDHPSSIRSLWQWLMK